MATYSLFVGKLSEDKSLCMRARDLIFAYRANAKNVIYQTIVHSF